MQIGCAVLLTDNQTADMQTEDILTVQPLYKYVLSTHAVEVPTHLHRLN